MDTLELMKSRHSVRRFTDQPLNAHTVAALNAEIEACNKESGLRMQLITDEPEAFQAEKPTYGQFKGCRNYLSIVGPRGKDVAAGYYGERFVLKAQALGVNSCWVALTYKKGKAADTVNRGEKRYLVIALGYGETNGKPRRSKTVAEVSDYKEGDPDWYLAGIEAALLAPTAVNQQKFRFELSGEKVKLKVVGIGFYTKTDLGIVKYHFELGAGRGKEIWI